MSNLSNFYNMSNLSTEELLKIKAAIEEELQRRSSQKVDELVVYQHDCFGSAGYHISRKKHWCKIVKAVDKTKSNGYAFIGDFLSIDRQTKIKENSIVVEVCGDTITAYRVTRQGKEKIGEAKINQMIEFIDKIAVLLQ